MNVEKSTNWQTLETLPAKEFVLLWNDVQQYPCVHMFTEGERNAAIKNPSLVYSKWARIDAPEAA